jgi:putative membrane protein
MKPMILAAAAAGAVLMTGGCMTNMGGGASAMGGMDMSDMTPEQARPFVMMAGASDLFEIQSSQLAVQRAQRPEVRQYAQMLVQHHTMTTQQVMAAARAAGMSPPPPMLMPMQREMMERLRAAPASSFDRTYITQQIPAHEMALALHGNYARRGDAASLRAVAATAVPVVTQHLAEARRMRSAM